MDEDGWSYWEAFNLFKGACANCTCLALFERGRNRAPNMAIIGTVLHRSFLRRLVDLVQGDEVVRDARRLRLYRQLPRTEEARRDR